MRAGLTALVLLVVLAGCAGARPAEQSAPSPAPAAQAPTPDPATATSAPIAALPTVSSVPTAASPTATSAPTAAPPTAASAPTAAPAYSYPIGAPRQAPGDGFVIRHGAGVENTWYSPGNWHTGEDWYAQEGDTAGALVYAVADGEVVYAGANYPGRVMIVRHGDGLFSMYGHLDPALQAAVGERVARGQTLGTVLARSDGRAASHLHFEIRTFLTTREVNGDAPRYDFRCGAGCPPGPGYWPIRAPDLPGALGWYNPTHVIGGRMFAGASGTPLGEVLVASRPVSASVQLWSAPPPDGTRRELGALALEPGARLPLLGVWAGPEDIRETTALAYQLWYQVRMPDGTAAWVQATVPLDLERGADGRPSSVGFNLLPAVSR